MTQINSPKDAAGLLKGVFQHTEQEELHVICMNGANEVKDIHLCSLGSDTACIICNKVIAKYAVLDMATGVIIAHNHPSGNPAPSMADIKRTETLREALKLFDITLVDHIIIGRDRYYSFSDMQVYPL